MPKDKHGTQVSDGDMLRFNDGTIGQVISYGGILYIIEGDYHLCSWPLVEFDSRDYEIIEEGGENENDEDELS